MGVCVVRAGRRYGGGGRGGQSGGDKGKKDAAQIIFSI